MPKRPRRKSKAEKQIIDAKRRKRRKRKFSINKLFAESTRSYYNNITQIESGLTWTSDTSYNKIHSKHNDGGRMQ